jgi:hypothetical protein
VAVSVKTKEGTIMGRYAQDLLDALFAAERAKNKFSRRKDAITNEVVGERVRTRRDTLPVELKVIVDRRMAADPVAKTCIAENQWHMQQAIMYSNLELVEQNKKIIDLLTALVEK